MPRKSYGPAALSKLIGSPEGLKKIACFLSTFGFLARQCSCDRVYCIVYESPYILTGMTEKSLVYISTLSHSTLDLLRRFFFYEPNKSIEWMHRMNTSKMPEVKYVDLTDACGVRVWKS